MKNIRKILSKFCKSIEHIYRKLTETLDKLGNFKKIWEKISNFEKFYSKFWTLQKFKTLGTIKDCTTCTVQHVLYCTFISQSKWMQTKILKDRPTLFGGKEVVGVTGIMTPPASKNFYNPQSSGPPLVTHFKWKLSNKIQK